MPDSSAIDAAVIQRLSSDATLTSLMPDGVYWDIAPHGKNRFVKVSLVIHEDEAMLADEDGDKDAFERVTYRVLAIELATSGSNSIAAAARINGLLHNQTFPVTGYGLMSSHRIERHRATEADEENADVRWQHRGGDYEIFVSPT